MILTGDSMVTALRDHCNHAKKRIWIASPFIGSYKDVCSIIGGQWMKQSVDFRVLTDAVAGFILKETLEAFLQSPHTEVRSLFSLHAKIYLVDDWCLVTSANLTGTAFSHRHEIGTEESDIKGIEDCFVNWWNLATDVKRLPKVNHGNNHGLHQYQMGKGMHFPKICSLPKYSTGVTDKFLAECDQFVHFAKKYEELTGRNKLMKKFKMPLLLEVDYFFNYLYNEGNQPSRKFKEKPPRKLSEKQRDQEIVKYFNSMEVDVEQIKDRLSRVQMVQSLLSPTHISKLSKDEIKNILNHFHCIYSQPINRTRILNNNSVQNIRKVWNELLNTGEITSEDVVEATSQIYSFGNSCVSELISWYRPDEFPIMNLNSRSGMRFFGENI